MFLFIALYNGAVLIYHSWIFWS